MSLVSLFFKSAQLTRIKQTVGGTIAPMLLDATLKETFTAPAEPTQHPVENGADVTDHVIIRPNGLTISGIITASPFNLATDLAASAGATVGSLIGKALGPFSGAAGILTGAGAVAGGLEAKSLAGSIFGSSDRDLGAVISSFVLIRDARQPVQILTGLRQYDSYILSSFSCSRDQKSGGSIQVDLEFKQILLVESQLTTVAIPKVAGALSKANKGRQSKAALTAAESGNSSLLLQGFQGVGFLK